MAMRRLCYHPRRYLYQVQEGTSGMKAAIIILACVFTGLWAGTLIAFHTVANEFDHDHAQIAQLTREVQSEKASIIGSHRDLITCADLFHLQMSGLSQD